MKHNDTGFISVSTDGAVRPARGVNTVLSYTRVLVVGDTSLGEREREAPKSQCTRKVIEASANMWERMYLSVCAFLREFDPPGGKRSASSFYRLKEGRITCTERLGFRHPLP